MKKDEILLESGTNELEVLEFNVGEACLGINVIKVREVINLIPATRVPESHRYIEGLINLRAETIPLVNLIEYLQYPSEVNMEKDKIIVTEFNQAKTGFHVNGVVCIHRVSWEQIHKPPDITQSGGYITGIIKTGEGKIILLLDFEKIMFDIDPSVVDKNLAPGNREDIIASDKNVVIVEDSPTLRKILTDYLPEIGYKNLKIFENGALAWEYLEGRADENNSKIREEIEFVITDIEMPQMDGLHLTRKIKEHHELKNLPVIIFSSLITDDLRHKGYSVGVDAQVSKPHFRDLARIISDLTA